MTAVSPDQATGPIITTTVVDTAPAPLVAPEWARRSILILALTFAALAGASGVWALAAVAVALVAAPAVVTYVADRVDARYDAMGDEALEDAEA